MSFLSRVFTGGASSPSEARDITGLTSVPTVYEDAMMTTGNYYAGMTETNAMTLSAFYACVTLLADTVASLSVKAYRIKDGVKTLVDPQPKLLSSSPYPECTMFSWLWMMMESLLVTGNAFGYITARGEDERPIAIMPVHPDVVRIEVPKKGDNDDPIYMIGGEKVPRDDIVHIKRYPIAGSVLGMSPVQKCAAQLGLGLAAERYGLRYFQDSANPSGLLTTKDELTDQQAKRAMRTWLQSHQGRRLPAVLSNGLEWQPISISPEESQFLETRKFQVVEIARIFRIPPHMIGETEKSTSYGTGIEHQALGFTKFNLNAWITCFEQEIGRLLPRGQTAEFSLDDLQRADFKTRWEGYRLGREAGVYSVNDIRQMEGLPPVEDGEGRIQPMNFAPLGYEPPKEPTQPTVKPAAKRYGDETLEIL